MKKVKSYEITPRTTSIYPEPFAAKILGREKRALGDLFGITKYGVNLTVLKPGAQSSLMHRHSKSEEFIYVLEGEITVITPDGELTLSKNECIGFTPLMNAHMLLNKTKQETSYLEIGDREPNDQAEYPQDDIKAEQDENGKWRFFHKDGQAY